MVHVQRSLQEVRRILVSGGVLVDVHPISVQSPVNIVHDGQYHFAGLFNAEYTMERRKMADIGLQEVVDKGDFIRIKQEEFVAEHFWDSVDALETHCIEQQSKAIRPPHVLEKARRIMKELGDSAQISVRAVLVIGRYEKM